MEWTGGVDMNDQASVDVEKVGAVQRLTIRGPRGNALDQELVGKLRRIIEIGGEDPGIRCILLTGAGEVFCSGQDLKAFQQPLEQVRVRWHLERTYNALILAIRRTEVPLLAAINGPVAGAGLGIALAADLRVAAERARFLFGFTGVGLTADSGVSLLLPTLIGLGRAAEMAFTNHPLTADQALSLGLVSRVLPNEDLGGAALELAAELADGPTQAYALTKRAFNQALLADLPAVLDHEAQLQEIASRTQDLQEGVQAFLQKRAPEFQGG
jgi:2-(1,2-epoxy-1,2-dihydrophenyl)acetyl-CoA isomerase